MPRYQGARKDNIPVDQRIDTRRWSVRKAEEWANPDEAFMLNMALVGINIISVIIPVAPILSLLPTNLLSKNFLRPKERLHDMPFRVPKYLNAPDGSSSIPNKPFKKNKKMYYGQGVTMFGKDLETGLQVWGTDSDDRTHGTILGTTGSGKTEFIHGLINNQLLQDSGFIAVDAKGDISFQRRACQLLRRYGREDDLLTISFAVGDRDYTQAQVDRPTNTFNIMSATSAGMLIELLSGMLDDSGGGGDMWKGRAIAFIAALTRPLTYLRDKGDIDLSPSKYMEYMELPELERLVYENNYNHPGFDEVLKPLRGYLVTLPGYDSNKRFNQETTTLEQFGYITMQLTRAINDLSYNYGHIFGAEVGEIDISDVVLNRRCLTVLLPSLERSLPTLNMLGKLIIGSIKQMMAGSLGSRLEGLTRVTVDSRPTTARNAFRIILDEVGYMMVTGMSVIPAQARALNIAMIFAAQSYTDIKRGSPEEAEAIWENSNIKFIGRIVGGDSTETWQKVKGAAGEIDQTVIDGFYQKENLTGDLVYHGNNTARRERRSQLEYHDVAGQEKGEFTLIVPKKYKGGKQQGVAAIRLLGLHTGGGTESDYMYINDLIPVSNTEKVDEDGIERIKKIKEAIMNGMINIDINNVASRVSGQTNLTNTLRQIDDKIQALSANGKLPLSTVFLTLSHMGNLLENFDDPNAKPANILDVEFVVNADTIHDSIDMPTIEQFEQLVGDINITPDHLQDSLNTNYTNDVFYESHTDVARAIENAHINSMEYELDELGRKIESQDDITEKTKELKADGVTHDYYQPIQTNLTIDTETRLKEIEVMDKVEAAHENQSQIDTKVYTEAADPNDLLDDFFNQAPKLDNKEHDK